jgi:hypothetical protein
LSIILFICALLSKETAILYPVLLGIYLFCTTKHKIQVKSYFPLIPYILIGALSILLFKSSVAQVAQDEITYTPHFSPGLILNNTMWYLLWGIGLPNYLPDYLQSIFLPPIPEFWKVMKGAEVRYHLYSVFTYISLFSLSTLLVFWKSNKKERLFLLFLFVIACGGFLLFISPTLTIIHKWMVRLTIPLIFLVLFQAFILYQLLVKKMRFLGILTLCFYLAFNYFGVHVHEQSSNFALENRFAHNAEAYFDQSREYIIAHHNTIYFKDIKGKNYWGGSKKLEITFHGSDFLDYYFPGKEMEVIWGYQNPVPPKDAYIMKSLDIIGE